jgi:hypothetical protein
MTDLILPRRKFLSLLAAPLVVSAASLMPVSSRVIEALKAPYGWQIMASSFDDRGFLTLFHEKAPQMIGATLDTPRFNGSRGYVVTRCIPAPVDTIWAAQWGARDDVPGAFLADTKGLHWG